MSMKQAYAQLQKEKQERCEAPGFYLVMGNTAQGKRHFISAEVDSFAFQAVANRVLNDRTGYDYWIDYCMGFDIERRIAWSNMDHTDLFI
jgi:hypothetical protein